MVQSRVQPGSIVIMLTPNSSATRAQTFCFFGALSFVTLLIGLLWGLMGAWLIMPFAGLEILVLLLGLRKVLREGRWMQVITIEKERIRVEEGETYPERSWEFEQPGTYIAMYKTDVPADTIQLSLVDPYKKIALGEFLNHQDLKSVSDEMQKAGVLVCSNRWWES